MQPAFKLKKPANLNLQLGDDNLNDENEIPELDTFEEFCSNIPDMEHQELNFSKQSKSFDGNQLNIQINESATSNEQNQSEKKSENNDPNIKYIEFVEFHPQSITSGQSESNFQRLDSHQSRQDIMQEPPAPQNKNGTKFSFPQKGGGFSSLKKQLCLDHPPISNHINNNSVQEETLVKQQSPQNQNLQIETELRKQIQSLNEQKQQTQQIHQEQVNKLQNENQRLEQELNQCKQQVLYLIQKNMVLQSKVENVEKKKVEDFQAEGSSDYGQQQLSMNDKLAYLIQKLNDKAAENAKLQYENLKLQNNIEILETQKLLQINKEIEITKRPLDQSPLIQPQSQNRCLSLSKDSRTSLVTSQKYPLNVSLNQTHQLEKKQQALLATMNHMISPLAKYNSVGKQQQSSHLQKNRVYKEDVNFHNMHTKNSTSVGELMSFKQDLTNCSNIINRALRKESYSTQSPDGKATQKFKQTLNSKMANQQENTKSYASLLFSLGDKIKDHQIKQSSPKNGNKKQKQLFGFINQQPPNSRKQSEILKSEESHKMSAENIRLSDNKKNTFSNSIDIFQIMKEMKSRKPAISAKINQKISITNKPTMTEIKSSRVNKQNFE